MTMEKFDPRKAFEKAMVELGRENDKIVAVSCDSASGGGLGSFFKEFPERSVEVGISEQTGVDIAAGMARMGLIPVIVVITPFLAMRAFEQVRNDVGYMHTNVKLVGSGGGLAYSTLGSSHAIAEDMAVMRTIPNLTILCPGDADEVAFALRQAVAIDGPVYIRMPRQARPLAAPTEERKLSLGKAEILKDGADAAIFTYGPSVEESQKAAALLKARGVDAAVVNCTTLLPLDEEAVLAYAKRARLLVTVEEHCVFGGLGTAVSEILAREGGCPPIRTYGIPVGAKATGPYEELLDYYGISGEKIAERIAADLKAL